MNQNVKPIVFLKKNIPIFREYMLKLTYKHHSGKNLDLKNPKSWSEKLLWMNKYWQPELKSICTDKYTVRDFVKSKGLEEILIPLLGVWTDAKKIDFDSLPNRFVLKANHGCAMNILCENKNELNRQATIEKLNKWLKINFAKTNGENHYNYISPKIICEEFLPVNDSSEIIDYKIHCFNGKPLFIGCVFDRYSKISETKGVIYSTDWERLFYLKDDDINDNITMPRPIKLEKMLEIASILSKDIPYVRVDLYAIKDQIFFGELTFTPDGNILDREYKLDIVKELGNYIELPSKIIRK